MTNDFLLDTDIDISNDLDTQEQSAVLGKEEEHLNEAYDRVSRNGAFPDMSAFGISETGKEIDDPFSNRMMYDNETSLNSSYDSELGNMSLPENDEFPEGDFGENDELEEPEQELTLLQLINSKHPPVSKLIRKILQPFMFIVGVSIGVTIFNNAVEYDLSQIASLSKKIEDTKGQSIMITNELAKFCKETEVAQRVESQSLGIHERKEPAQYLTVTKYRRPDSLKNEMQLFKQHWQQLHRRNSNNM